MRILRVALLAAALALLAAVPALCDIGAPVVLDASAPEAYMNDLTLTDVIISKDSAGIGARAFKGCANLERVILPASVTAISADAFEGCDKLTLYGLYSSHRSYARGHGIPYVDRALTTPDFFTYVVDEEECTLIDYTGEARELVISEVAGFPVVRICYAAFAENDTLQKLTIAGSVRELERYAFVDCTALKSVKLEEGVEFIDGACFYGCRALKALEVPASVRRITANPVGCCTSMSTLSVAEGNEFYVAEDGILYDAGMTRLVACPAGRRKSVTIPMGVRCIEVKAFENCIYISSVKIPPTVTRIGEDAFFNCISLSSVELPVSVEKVEYNPFDACFGLKRITVAGDNPFFAAEEGVLYDRDLTQVITVPPGLSGRLDLPDSVREIGDYAFGSCKLTGVTLPEGLEVIPWGAFEDCDKLTEIGLPSTVREIDSYAFKGCSALKSIELPEGLTRIGSEAFEGCKALRHLTVPPSVTSIGSEAFEGCDKQTLHGEAGSEAERYAGKNDLAFTTEAE